MRSIMNISEVANYLRVTTKTIYRLLKRGGIPAAKVGHSWRFDQATIDEWLRNKSITTKASILIVDDEEVIRALFKETLMRLGHSVITAETGSKAVELVRQQDIDLVFLDLKMPDLDGVEIFSQIKTIKPNLPVTIITGYPESDMMVRVLARGPFGVMNKPFSESDIITAVNNFLRITRQ